LIYYIYKIEVKGTKKYYIGQRMTEKVARPEDDTLYMGSGVALAPYAHKQLSKTILSVHTNADELNEAEAAAIGELYRTDSNCLNKMKGGAAKKTHSYRVEDLPATWESKTVDGQLYVFCSLGKVNSNCTVRSSDLLRCPTVKAFIYALYLSEGGEPINGINIAGEKLLPYEVTSRYILSTRGRNGRTYVHPAILKMMLMQLGPEVQVALLTDSYKINVITTV
jgi:hypothetical protein